MKQKKYIKRSIRLNKKNATLKSILRTAIKKFKLAIKLNKEKKDNIYSSFKKATSIIDKISRKGIIHRNKANRYKRRIALLLNSFV